MIAGGRHMNKGFLAKLKKSDLADKISLIIAMIIMVIVFTYLNKNYFSVPNLMNILTACSLMGFVAIGETYLIIANQIDLTAGATAAFAGVLAARLLRFGAPGFIALIAGVLAGIAIGAVNATMINYLRLQPFIATLASMSIVRGFAYIMCNGKAVSASVKSFTIFGSFRLFGIVPLPVIILLAAFLVFGYILKSTYYGRSVYVLGGNAYAARLAGMNPKKIIYKLHIVEGALTGLAGVLLAARMNSGQPSACDGLEFDAVTAAVLGGCAFTGGVGTMLGTFIGMVILQGFNTGMNMVGLQTFWQQVAKGLLLVVALAFDFYRKRSREKKLLEDSKKAR